MVGKGSWKARCANKQDGAGNRTYEGFNARWDASNGPRRPTRRLRNYELAPPQVWRFAPARFAEAHFATFPAELVERCLAIGCPEGGVVLDPFAGAGTTGLVASRLGFDAVLCELSEEYAGLAVERIEREAPMLADVRAEPVQGALL